jgi:hypothetical protein
MDYGTVLDQLRPSYDLTLGVSLQAGQTQLNTQLLEVSQRNNKNDIENLFFCRLSLTMTQQTRFKSVDKTI